MVNRHRAHWSSMSTGKYDFEPEKLEQDLKAHMERKTQKKETIKAMFEGMVKSDPARQEETFQMFVEVLKEWKEENQKNGGLHMKKFIIKLDDKYYAGEGQPVKRNSSSGGCYIHNLGSSSIAVGSREDAKIIEGYTNLRSNWERINDAMRYNKIDCGVIVIEAVE